MHAATLIRKGQRAQLEKLCRYVTRPAICLKRLSVRPDGMVSWLLRKPWRDGTKGFLLTPYQFIARLAAIVPHPREHQLTYQGVLAPASPLRDQVVTRSVARKEPKEQKGADANPAGSHECSGEQPKGQRTIRWADLLKRVFASDVLKCPHCGGRRHLISARRETDGARGGAESAGVCEERGKEKSRAIEWGRGSPERSGSLTADRVQHSDPDAASSRAAGIRDVERGSQALRAQRGPMK